MNTERDRFLTEAMGECWHDMEFSHPTILGGLTEARCLRCKRSFISDGPTETDIYFSEWSGFGKLWEWAQRQKWWSSFCYKMEDSLDWDVDDFLNHNIHPDRFANAVYEFLKERQP